MKKFIAYIKRVGVAIDQMVNVLFGGLPDETISARWERNNYLGTHHFISHLGSIVLTWLQFHHGSKAVEHDRERAETVEEVEIKTEGKDV